MLSLLIILHFFAEGSKENATGVLQGILVHNVESKLTECAQILQAVEDFHHEHHNSDDERRLSGDEDEGYPLVSELETTLDTCTAVIEAVNNFYRDYRSVVEYKDVSGAWKDPIILNVGGEHFSTTLATLRSVNGTFFWKMFREGSETTCSADGTFFIDRNPSTFKYILDFLRNGDMLVKSGDRDIRKQVLDDAEYFELPEELKAYLRWSSLDNIDLTFSEVSFINEELGSLDMGGLLYQASKDGDSSSNFHTRCDGEGPTVTIIETTSGNVFGGYTAASWSSSSGYGVDSSAFLFRLRPSRERYSIATTSVAIYRHPSYGPVFGNTALYIAAECMDNAKSYVDNGDGYATGTGYVLNDGSHDFRVQDYAVVQVL